MPLNPHAKPFLPKSQQREAKGPEKLCQEQLGLQPSPPTKTQPEDAPFPLADLPSELLAAVAAGLDTPNDLWHAAIASKRLLAAIRDACVRIALTPQQQYALNNPRNSARLDAMVACIAKYYQGATELHLPNLPLEVHHVQALLAALPHLATLDLSACKKLTPPLVAILSYAAQLQARHGSAPSIPTSTIAPAEARDSSDSGDISNTRSISSFMTGAGAISSRSSRPYQLLRMNLQRCYQLDAECLPALLSLPLQCLALSHLELRFCPWSSIGRGCGLSLRTLALNNCSQLSGAGLLALARGCSQLEHLFLGGCTFAASDVAVPAMETDTAIPGAPATMRAVDLFAGAGMLLFQQQPPQSAAALALHGASAIAAMLAELPRLEVLEVTFLGVSRLPFLQARSAAGRQPAHTAATSSSSNSSSSGNYSSSSGSAGRGRPAIWDLCRPEDVRAALAACQAAGTHSNLAMALRCAVNASGKGRTTPLHVAADAGDTERCAALLALGASPSARDGGGSVPLFLAAEGGHAAAARQLLSAPGADARVCNTAGESPLYISALRGHVAVVGVLLEHLSAAGVPWQQTSLYGDAWTPLMAAAVADRTDVAGRLLAAAGPSARALVAAANRYGQTVMHIAARKGSSALLALLVKHGGAEGAWVADSLGETPVDIARKNRHQDFFRLVVAAA